MAGQNGGGGRVIYWLALIGLLGLVVGAVIGGAISYRGANLEEVTRIVEVTREVTVALPIEVTRSVIETRVVEVTRIVEIVRDPPTQDSLSNQSSAGAPSKTIGSAVIGVLLSDGRVSTGTHTVALFPKTLISDIGEAQPNREQEIRIPVNEQTGFAEAYGLLAGTYTVCLKSLLHTATVGEIEIIAGKVTRVDLRWPAEVEIIRVECVLR